MKKILVLAVFCSFIFGTEFVIDKAHSSVDFKIKHMQISKINGNFSDFDGVVEF